MKRSTTLILSLLFILTSCGTGFQFAEQKFVDGIYSRPAPAPAPEPVRIYSQDDFAEMAADNIEKEKINDAFESGLLLGLGLSSDWYFSPWYHSPWYFGSWHYHYSPWHHRYGPWHYRYFDPWFFDPWYFDYWYYDNWYYDSWYHHYWHGAYHPVGIPPRKPGLSNDGYRYYGARMDTQTGGSRVSRPGSSRSNYRRGVNESYGSAGASIIGGGMSSGTSVRPSGSSSSSGRPSVTSPSGNYNYTRIAPKQNTESRPTPSTRSSAEQNSNSSSNRSNNNFNYSRGSSSGFGGTSSGFGGGGGSYSRSGGGGGSSRSGGRR